MLDNPDSLPTVPWLSADILNGLPQKWLVTGVAGFIGSHLLEVLLRADRHVVGLENFVTGTGANLQEVESRVSTAQWRRFTLIEGDVRSPDDCASAVADVDVVLHQAALNSVPRSLKTPAEVAEVNVMGMVQLLNASVGAAVKRFVYASSSSVYGDSSQTARTENQLGRPLSPYAASKRSKEAFGDAFHLGFQLPVIGLRYFNVFGPRQNPLGPYSAVIPRWISSMLDGERPVIYGDGEQSRDFTHVNNVVYANLCAAVSDTPYAVLNVGTSNSISLRRLFSRLRDELLRLPEGSETAGMLPIHEAPRVGDVRSALADLDAIRAVLSYDVVTDFEDGIRDTVSWFARRHEPSRSHDSSTRIAT